MTTDQHSLPDGTSSQTKVVLTPGVSASETSTGTELTESEAHAEVTRVRHEDNNYLIQQMRGMEFAPPPDNPELKQGDVVHQGTEDLPFPMVASEVSGPGKVFVYRTNSGERVEVSTNLFPGVMKKRFPMDHPTHPGERSFAAIDPGFRPTLGTIKCILHKDDSNRHHYDSMGLPVCRKSNMTSMYMRDIHMERKHPTAWRTLEDTRRRRERDEDREFQRTVMSNVSPMASPPEPVPWSRRPRPFACDCGRGFPTRVGLASHRRLKHPEAE